MNSTKIIYWVATGLMCALFLFSASMYFMQNEMIQGAFQGLGFPTWLIYPLATAKILGVVAVLTKQSKTLKEWAYAGFFYDALLAAAAHRMVGDGQEGMAIFGIVLVLLSYIYDKKLYR